MDNNTRKSTWCPQFTMQSILMMVLLVAVALGWFNSWQHAQRERNRQEIAQQYIKEELARARDELRDADRIRPDATRTLWEAEFDGTNLSGATIASPSNAFQRASFKSCDLENATLQGGVSAFQLARFDRAKLAKAKLTGGIASFQSATFVDADLTGAVLKGGGTSFQGSSFENAKLVQAQLTGSFQSVNISGAQFEGADLSALDSSSLGSCYFKEAPTYDDQTKFPADFDPVAKLWKRVSR